MTTCAAAKGRRGLEVLEALQREPDVDVEVIDDDVPGVPEVDAKLVRLCLDRDAALLTLDTNLAKAAALAGVRVMNLHALALALRPPVTAGDEVTVLLHQAGQGAGPGRRLPRRRHDGGRRAGPRVASARSSPSSVTSVLTTANGRMVFAHPVGVTT